MSIYNEEVVRNCICFQISPHIADQKQKEITGFGKHEMARFMRDYRQRVQEGHIFVRTENAISLCIQGRVLHLFVTEMCSNLVDVLADGYNNFKYLFKLTDEHVNEFVYHLQSTGTPKLITFFKSEKNRNEALKYIMKRKTAVVEKMVLASSSADFTNQWTMYGHLDGDTVVSLLEQEHRAYVGPTWARTQTPVVLTTAYCNQDKILRTLFFLNPLQRIELAYKRARIMYKTQHHLYADWEGELCRRMGLMTALWPLTTKMPPHAPYLETVVLLNGTAVVIVI